MTAEELYAMVSKWPQKYRDVPGLWYGEPDWTRVGGPTNPLTKNAPLHIKEKRWFWGSPNSSKRLPVLTEHVATLIRSHAEDALMREGRLVVEFDNSAHPLDDPWQAVWERCDAGPVFSCGADTRFAVIDALIQQVEGSPGE